MPTTLEKDKLVDTVPVPRPDPAPVGRPLGDAAIAAPINQETLPSEPWYSYMVAEIRQIPADAGDDLRQDIGPTIYRERMMRDPQVSAAIKTETLITLAQELDILPLALSGEPEYEQDLLFVKHCKAQIDQLEQPFHELLYEMHLAGAVDGHQIAEIVCTLKTINEADGPQYWLETIHTKPHDSYTIGQDANNNVYGFVPRYKLRGGAYRQTATIKELGDDLLPKSKFLIYSNHPIHGNILGTSDLRPVFHPWWMKVQTWASYAPYLAISAEPIFAYYQDKDGPNTWPVWDATLNRTVNVDTRTYAGQMMQSIRGKVGIFFPKGDKGAFLSPPANGSVFDAAFERFNAEIVKAITLQQLATEQGEHSSRAQATVHQDQLGLKPRHGRRMLAHMIRQLFKVLLILNYGPPAAARAPQAQLGQTEQWDLGEAGQVIAQLKLADGIFPSQLKAIYAAIGLPAASDEDITKYAALFWENLRNKFLPKQQAPTADQAGPG